MRVFVGVPIPEDVKKNILVLQKEIAKSDADVKLVEPEQLHFTMKFLGNISKNEIKTVVQKLKKIHWSSFAVELHGVGVFPHEKSVRVVWVGIKEKQDFISLIKTVQRELKSFRKEDHNGVVAHLTVARVRSPKHLNQLLSVLKQFQEKVFGSFLVEKFVLYESVLTGKGPIYTVVEEFQATPL